MASRSSEPEFHTGAEPPTPLSPTNVRGNSRKRPRPTVIIDDMGVDDIGGAVRRKKSKSTGNKPSVPATPLYTPVDSLAGPSSSLPFKPTLSLSVPTTNSPTEVSYIKPSNLKLIAASLLDGNGGILDDARAEVDSLRQELAYLKERSRMQDRNHEEAKMRLAQDMFLDRMRDQKKSADMLERIQRQKHWTAQYARNQEEECEKQRLKAQENGKKYAKTVVDLNYYKDETEHLQSLNKIMEEDLDELRRIDNEDRTHRLHNKYDLPPAYGSLDDEEPFAPPMVHLDAGSLDIADFKRAVRSDFMLKLEKAQNEIDMLQGSNEEKAASEEIIFIQSSLALADSSRALRAALDHAQSMYNKSIDYEGEDPSLEGLEKCRTIHEKSRRFKRSVARQAFVADRVARMLLDLNWRVVSASELRPVIMMLTSRDKSMLCLAYKEVDDCFLEALRQKFTLDDRKSDGTSTLWEYQHYLTQISAVRRSFNNLGAGLSYSLFSKSWEWLSDQVELARMHRANRDANLTVQAVSLLDPGQIAGSVASSEIPMSESDISENSGMARS